jgi:prolyl-tRNA synthetase
MRYSHLFGKTVREAPSDASATSHRLLYRAGFIRELAAGRYTLLPLGQRVAARIVRIIAEEMDATGGQRIVTPTLHPLDLWEQSGRTASMGELLMRVQDRRGTEFALGYSAEEVFVDLVKGFALTHRDLPLTLYQLSLKFRDELRARGGLLRLREFLMKDAYSFHASEESLDETYRRMYDAYLRIFARLGVRAFAVEADSGAIGGKVSHEFIVAAESGESVVLLCPSCGYAASDETATARLAPLNTDAPLEDVREVPAPGATTIDKMAQFYGAPAWQMMKTVVYRLPTGVGKNASGDDAQARYVGAVVRGDLDVNEVKLRRALGSVPLEQATDEEVLALGTVRGFIAPVRFPSPFAIRWVGDPSLRTVHNFFTGANRLDVDLAGVNYPRDFTVAIEADIATARGGMGCSHCDGVLTEQRGIETGHIFKLGTLYSAAMDATFADADGTRHPFVMGCYGIGVERNMAAVVEQCHDEHGIIWPQEIAPYAVHLLALGGTPAVQAAADQMYETLCAAGVDVLYDDRDASAGVKFADADLIGIPLRVTVSARTLAEDAVELKRRAGGEPWRVPRSDLLARLPVLIPVR